MAGETSSPVIAFVSRCAPRVGKGDAFAKMHRIGILGGRNSATRMNNITFNCSTLYLYDNSLAKITLISNIPVPRRNESVSQWVHTVIDVSSEHRNPG